MERGVDGDDVADLHHLDLFSRWKIRPSSFGRSPADGGGRNNVMACRTALAAQHREADAAGRDRADVHALHVMGACNAVGDIPTAFDDP